MAFTCYASTLADVVVQSDKDNNHEMNIAGYADDHSLYTSFRSGDPVQEKQAVHNMQHVLLRLKDWLVVK